MQYFTIAIYDNSLVKALKELDETVRERISREWKPLGGVCVIQDKDSNGYYAGYYVVQAMIKE